MRDTSTSPIVVFPLPGGPNRKIDFPEFTAGPSCASEVFGRHVDVRDGLTLDRRDIGRERHRRLAHVLAARERLLRLLRAAVDDDELVRRRRDTRAAADLDE